MITGGHLTPALAVIEELRKSPSTGSGSGWEIIFIGRKQAAEGDPTPSVESEIIPELGIPFYSIEAGRIQRQLTRWLITSLLKIPLGFWQAFFLIGRLKPDVILSFGGYVSAPIVLAGWLFKIPSVTHEQTTVKGLATRFNSLFANKIAVSWPKSVEQFPQDKVVLTGNPIRKEISKVNPEILKLFNFDSKLPLVLVTGGNQGSHLINQAVMKSLPRLLELTNIFHQCGHLEGLGDFEKLAKARQKLPYRLKKRYHIKKYLDSAEMGTLLNRADLVVSRGGINTISELLALGKPSLLIPHSWIYKSEQERNAEMLAGLGVAEILPTAKVSSRTLTNKIRLMLTKLSLYRRHLKEAKNLIKKDASKKIVELVEGLA